MFSVRFNCWSDFMKLGGMLVQQRVPTSEEWAILKRLTATCSHYIFQNMQNQRSFSPQVFIQMLPKSTQMVEIKCPEWHSDRRQWQFMHAISDKHLNARGSIKERILFKLVLIRNHLFIFLQSSQNQTLLLFKQYTF